MAPALNPQLSFKLYAFMSHSFVAARLLSRLPKWTTYKQKASELLVTTPFLALHVVAEDPDKYAGPNDPNLFIVSSEKPETPHGEYFTLNDPEDKESLTVTPSLQFPHPLYLFVTPRIWCKFPESETYERLAKAEQYQLDPPSLERFMKAVKNANPSIPSIRETANGEEPPSNWDTWSGNSPRETPGLLLLRRYVPFFFDLVPFETLPINLTTDVLEEIALYRQLYLDYTWEGCMSTLEYTESMRNNIPRFAAFGRIARSPSLSVLNRVLGPSVYAARPSVNHLKTLTVPHDGDPQVNTDMNDEDDEDNKASMKEAKAVPIVTTEKVKVIALDCDSIIDNDNPLREALSIIFPPSIHQFPIGELLRLYVEKEALLKAEGQTSTFAIIQEVARYLNATVSQSAVENAFARCEKLKFHEDALPAISSWVESGCSIVALPLAGSRLQDIISLEIPGISFTLVDRVHADRVVTDASEAITWNILLQFCGELNPGISASEILVVTPNLYAVAEPAALAGFPTMFIKRPRSRCLALTIPTFFPTFIAEGMNQILPIILDPSSAVPPQEPGKPIGYTPFRIRDCYQITSLLGLGSHWNVWNGIQVVTGTQVAMKFDIIKDTKPSNLAYEAAIFAQLEGVQGLVKIRWVGTDHDTHVLVMDKLGPNLERFRRFCRGAMSLKTVLMLGEQMLTTIEEVHAHGIIVRDIKPQNFALGLIDDYKCLYLLDMGMCKLYFDPTTGKHMPFRDERGGLGTPRYASHNVHFGLEPSRRDDVEAIGILLLYLLHGRLPWQGICAADIPSKLKGIGEMKRGKAMKDLLARSPPFFTQFIQHCRSLAFEDKPDYGFLKELLRREMEEQGWEYDWNYDWWVPGERGTLLPDEYRLEKEFIEPVRHSQDTL